MPLPYESIEGHDIGGLQFRLRAPGDLEALGERWRALEARARCSFFQSWGWIGTWLDALPPDERPFLLEVRRKRHDVALGLLGRRKVRRHGLLPSAALFLSQTGKPALDSLTVEHNGFLIEEASYGAIVASLFAGLDRIDRGWDEIFAGGIDSVEAPHYADGARRSGLLPEIRLTKPCYLVDCAALRASSQGYLDALSSNTRYQIRRSMRAYGARGDIAVHVAASVEEAHRLLDRLCELHAQHWSARGSHGAFASAFALRFHRNLIAARLPLGEVQLLEIRAGRSALGYLYNFAYRGTISNYQSGFAYEEDARFKPGLVSHACAVEHAVAAGAQVYDLLMGEQRYKQSLATHRSEMSWLVVQKPLLRFRVERLARKCRDRLHDVAMRARPSAAVAPRKPAQGNGH